MSKQNINPLIVWIGNKLTNNLPAFPSINQTNFYE